MKGATGTHVEQNEGGEALGGASAFVRSLTLQRSADNTAEALEGKTFLKHFSCLLKTPCR